MGWWQLRPPQSRLLRKRLTSIDLFSAAKQPSEPVVAISHELEDDDDLNHEKPPSPKPVAKRSRTARPAEGRQRPSMTSSQGATDGSNSSDRSLGIRPRRR